MKKIKLMLLGLLIVFSFVGCSLFNDSDSSSSSIDTVNEMDYFNKCIEELNTVSASIKTLHAEYENSVPLEVTAEDEITFSAVNKAEVGKQVEQMQINLLQSNLKIENQEKQTDIENLLNDYISKSQAYLTTFETVGDFYSNSEYKTNLEEAKTYETEIQAALKTMSESEDNVYNKLKEYQKNSPYRAKINSQDPTERLNASIDLLTDETETLYSAYMVDWDTTSEPTAIREQYSYLSQQRDQIVTNLDELDYSDVSVVTIKNYFDASYIEAINNFLTDIKITLDDYDAGKITAESVENYDYAILESYEEVIVAHNYIISLTEDALNVQI